MVALTLVDHLMMHHAQCELLPDVGWAISSSADEEESVDPIATFRPNPMGKASTLRAGATAQRARSHESDAHVMAEAASVVSQRIDEE